MSVNFLSPASCNYSWSTGLSSFIKPQEYFHNHLAKIDLSQSLAILPTYNPDADVFQLVKDLVRWNKEMWVVVVNDSSTPEYLPIFEQMQGLSEKVVVFKTPTNKLKCAAINFGLNKVWADDQFKNIKTIITLDDDVSIRELTIQKLVAGLNQDPGLGIACSRAGVQNKNANLLTRLQGLEFCGFNITRIADEGFFQGPLVMHGMLVAYRRTILEQVGGLHEKHLIEDYEITVRIKQAGWRVKAVVDAWAWAEAPEKLSKLWRQRVRWMYGGLHILSDAPKFLIIQDFLGHLIFIAGFILIIASLFLKSQYPPSANLASLIINVTLVSSIVWYIFQLWTMRFYPEKDKVDWLIRIILIPEFLYANLMTLILLGSYLFFIYNKLAEKFYAWGRSINQLILKLFNMCGYSDTWGTR